MPYIANVIGDAGGHNLTSLGIYLSTRIVYSHLLSKRSLFLTTSLASEYIKYCFELRNVNFQCSLPITTWLL